MNESTVGNSMTFNFNNEQNPYCLVNHNRLWHDKVRKIAKKKKTLEKINHDKRINEQFNYEQSLKRSNKYEETINERQIMK